MGQYRPSSSNRTLSGPSIVATLQVVFLDSLSLSLRLRSACTHSSGLRWSGYLPVYYFGIEFPGAAEVPGWWGGGVCRLQCSSQHCSGSESGSKLSSIHSKVEHLPSPNLLSQEYHSSYHPSQSSGLSPTRNLHLRHSHYQQAEASGLQKCILVVADSCRRRGKRKWYLHRFKFLLAGSLKRILFLLGRGIA